MKLCLKCGSLWSSEAVYCGKCRRPIGKRCPKGHEVPFFSSAITCMTCNEGPLDGVPYLALAWIAPTLTLLLLVAFWRWSWHHPMLFLCLLWQAFLWVLGMLFGAPPGQILGLFQRAVAWYIVLWLLTYLLPKATGHSTRQFLKTLPRHIWKGLHAVLRFVFVLVQQPLGHGRAKAKIGHQKDPDKGTD